MSKRILILSILAFLVGSVVFALDPVEGGSIVDPGKGDFTLVK